MIKLQNVETKERDLLWNINQKYLYEMMNFYDDPMDENGNYHYDHFDEYFTDPKRKAYFIYCDDKLAGFAMLNPYSNIDQNPDFTMAEFTIFPQYRRRHVALDTAKLILSQHPGKWEIKYNEKNYGAKRLWNTLVGSFNPEIYHLNEEETVLALEGEKMGLFEKKFCALCGGKAGLITRYKLVDGDFICGDCRSKMSPHTDGIGQMNLDDIKEQIRLKEENDERFQNGFVNTRQYDFDSRHPMMAVDDEHGEFAILKDDRPDIFSFDEVVSYNVDLHTKVLTDEERKKKDAGIWGIMSLILSDDFHKQFPDMPRCPMGCKVTGMYFQINFGENRFHADKIRIDMLPGWSTNQTEVEKAYRCANDMYQCFREYKEGMRSAYTTSYDSSQEAADPIEQVKKLKELLDMGALTQEEFDAKKKELLGL